MAELYYANSREFEDWFCGKLDLETLEKLQQYTTDEVCEAYGASEEDPEKHEISELYVNCCDMVFNACGNFPTPDEEIQEMWEQLENETNDFNADADTLKSKIGCVIDDTFRAAVYHVIDCWCDAGF